MGKLSKEIFNESCCDGGACNPNDMSARVCGCDKGANWVCQRHQYEKLLKERENGPTNEASS
jgi:hypothetical protein